MPSDFVNFVLAIDGPVARIGLLPFGTAFRDGEPVDPHWELAELLNHLQYDNKIRVVVMTGADGESFLAPRPSQGGTSGPAYRSPAWLWKVATGIVRVQELMAKLDKPIVAAIKGDAIGIGSSLLFGADIIIAREDARVADVHMGMGETEPFHWTTGVVPGDGGCSLLPLFLSPPLAKEYLMLARSFDAAELARLGAINYALPAADVGARVEEIVAALLKRPAFALAWTKRVANMHVVDQLHRTLDAGVAYELINMLQYVAEGGDAATLD